MSNLVKFAVEFGCSARLRSMSKDELLAEMDLYSLTLDEKNAILSREVSKLSHLSNGDVYCLLFPEKPEDEEDGNDKEEEEISSSEKVAFG